MLFGIEMQSIRFISRKIKLKNLSIEEEICILILDLLLLTVYLTAKQNYKH